MQTSFELTLDDTSPVINYYPFSETLGAPDLLAGWNSYFSQSGFLSQLGETGFGDSFHVTSLDGAALTIQWFGTGISLFGSVVDAAYQVSLDGAVPSIGLPRQDILVEFQNLEPKQHLLMLIAHPNGVSSNTSSNLAFDRASLNISTDLTGASVSSEGVDAASPRWIFSGDWTERSEPSLMSESKRPYRVSNTRGSTASIAFTGSAVTLTGIRNDTNGHYNVTLDGTTTMFDGHSDWLGASTLFLQAGLNETITHTLTVTNDEDATLAITGINITHVSGGTASRATEKSVSGVPTGTVVGVVFAIVFGILAVATVALCIYFRRRRQRNRRRNFTAGGITSADFFRDLDAGWSPMRRHRPMHVSRNSEYALQDLYTAPPHRVDGSERDIRKTGAESPVVLIANGKEEIIDPASPLPYLRSSKTSFAMHAPGSAESARLQAERVRETGVESVVRDLFAAHMNSGSGVIDSTEPPRAEIKPLNLHSRRRSTITDTLPPQRPRVEIPQGDPAPGPLTGVQTSQRAWRSPLLLQSPRRSTRLTTQRDSETSGHAPLLPSVSTIRFARPWDERSEGASTRTDTTAVMAEKVTSPSLPAPPPEGVSSDFLERIRSHKTHGHIAPPGLSDWKSPW